MDFSRKFAKGSFRTRNDVAVYDDGCFLPYGRQLIDDDDIASVVDVLRGDWLTTGPAVSAFEKAISQVTGASNAVAVNSGTAALHMAMHALGVEEGDEVIVPPITFAATSNSVLYCGGRPVFVDVQPENLLIDPAKIEAAITPRTKGIIAVDYAGQPCDWNALRALADKYNLFLVADSCHALGAAYKGRVVGTLADITIFSFHPVKHITTGEGGMAVTDDAAVAEKMRVFRSHGITTDAQQRVKSGSWFYEMKELGYNYRITDIQCALGLSQLPKLEQWVKQRNILASSYADGLRKLDIFPLITEESKYNAYHLYVVRSIERDSLFSFLRNKNIGVNVHYTPVYLHPYYVKLGYNRGLCPVAEQAYSEILSLPLWPGMALSSVERVLAACNEWKKLQSSR